MAKRRFRTSLTSRWAGVGFGLVWMSLLLLPACGKKAAEGASPAASASATGSGSAGVPAPSSVKAPQIPSGAADPMSTLYGSMATEAATRPHVRPSMDDAFAAFGKAGLPVEGAEQSLGRTYRAGYCTHGLTPKKDLAVLVCEYVNAEAAAVGLAASKTVFVQLGPRRQSFIHKELMMAIMQQQGDENPVTLADEKKLVTIFNGL
jgi:hypothetical protein